MYVHTHHTQKLIPLISVLSVETLSTREDDSVAVVNHSDRTDGERREIGRRIGRKVREINLINYQGISIQPPIPGIQFVAQTTIKHITPKSSSIQVVGSAVVLRS